MEHCCLAFIRLIKLHVIICSGADILHIFHIIIDTFDHVMTGRADCYQILALFFGLIKSTYGRKLRSNLVSSQRINLRSTASLRSLPVQTQVLWRWLWHIRPDLSPCFSGYNPDNNCTSYLTLSFLSCSGK